MQYHTCEIQAQIESIALLVLEGLLKAKLLRREDSEAKDGLNKQKEECFEVVLSLVFRQQVVLLLELVYKRVERSRVVVYVHRFFSEVLSLTFCI